VDTDAATYHAALVKERILDKRWTGPPGPSDRGTNTMKQFTDEVQMDLASHHTPRLSRPFARVSAVIPTFNEAGNLPHVFARLPMHELFEVILVDGRSTDDTIEVARELLPSIRVVLQDGIGKGNALACGFAAARGDIIVMLDADGSTDPAEIPAYLDALFGGADFAKGSRFMPGGDSTDITPVRRLGNACLNRVVNVLYGTDYTDLCYGYNAFWSDMLPIINVSCAGFEVETLINIRIAKAGLQIAEVPSVEHERIFGVSKLHPVRDGLRVLRTIVAERFRSSGRPPSDPPSFRELERSPRAAGTLIADFIGRPADMSVSAPQSSF
jgi:glycosyl transferase family 2